MKDIDKLEVDIMRTIGKNTYTSMPYFDIELYKKKKGSFYKEFGDNYWLEKKDVYVERSPEYLEERYNFFIKKLKMRSTTIDLANFIQANGITGFYNNSVSITEAFFRNEKISFRRGTKLSKVFKSLIGDPEYIFEESLEDIRNEYSTIIGQKSITGNLRISIHPYDYLTMSENNNGWRSCHSLDGEYGSGVLSYMTDASTLVAYLYTEDNANLKRMPDDITWNSKKWRALLYISHQRNLVVVSKHYPYQFDAIEKEVLELLKTVYPGDWIIRTEPRKKIKEFLFDSGSLHFNDILKSKQHMETTTFVKYIEDTISVSDPIFVGGKVMCIDCGQNEVHIQGNYHCLDCCDYSMCDRCGELIYEHNTFVPENGEFLCESCYISIMEEDEDDLIDCDICRLDHSSETMRVIMEEGRCIAVCPDCEIDILARRANA